MGSAEVSSIQPCYTFSKISTLMASWGYNQDNGPSQWHNEFPVALSGTRRSPVNIVPACCSSDSNLGELKYEYSPAIINIINTGSSWRMDFSPDGSNLCGAPWRMIIRSCRCMLTGVTRQGVVVNTDLMGRCLMLSCILFIITLSMEILLQLWTSLMVLLCWVCSSRLGHIIKSLKFFAKT